MPSTANPRTDIVRAMSSGDAVTYRALRLRGLKEHPDAFTSGHDEEAAKPLSVTEARLAPEADGRMWGAFVDGALVGAIGLLREPRLKIRHKGDVFGMYVAQEHAGRGVGTALLSHLIGEARRQPGIEQLVLTVTETNGLASALSSAFSVSPAAAKKLVLAVPPSAAATGGTC